MLTGNLWLLITIHTLWDVDVKIPGYYIGIVANETFLEILNIIEGIISNGVLPALAIWICFWCHKKDYAKLPECQEHQ